jgi:6-phospho-3-hexuloisomerase
VDFAETQQRVINELDGVLAQIDEESPKRMSAAILQARRIVCHGVGREGLMMRALAMRLMHLGFEAHATGEMSTPPLNAGDLLIASAGPGNLATVIALMSVARNAGARVMLVTAQPGGKAAQIADDVIILPAQTLADGAEGSGSSSSVLTMGSLFELVQHLFFDLIALDLQEQTDQSEEQLRRRHTNLE